MNVMIPTLENLPRWNTNAFYPSLEFGGVYHRFHTGFSILDELENWLETHGLEFRFGVM